MTPEKNGALPHDWPYRFAIISLKHMIVDAYQRPLTTFVERIEKNYNPALIGTLCVSERTKTKYAVIDGQTRCEGMKRKGEKEAPCIVFEDLTLQQEAELFAKFQTERRGMTSASRFRAQVIAGYPEAVAIDKIVSEQGFTISTDLKKDANALRAVAALEYVYRGATGGTHTTKTDPELLADTLSILRAAWPKLPDTAKSKPMIRGLGHFLARDLNGKPRTSDLDVDRLIDRLSKITPSELAKRAEALRDGRGMAGYSPVYVAEAIEAQYRKR